MTIVCNRYTDLLLKILDARKDEPVDNQLVSAVTVAKHKVLAIGHNSRKSARMQRRFCKHPLAIYLHAEIDCLKNTLKNYTLSELNTATIYVARRSRAGNVGTSTPCEGCMQALIYYGVKNIVATNKEGYFERINTHDYR